MQVNSSKLFIEINRLEFKFVVVQSLENDNFELIYKKNILLQGFTNNKISDFDLVHNLFQKNIYSIEQKLNLTFKEATVIINNFDFSLINFSGYKKLNGSQLVKEDITYIINLLKSKIIEIEKDKSILHIFNTKSLLDKKEIKNLPIGLFGNLYSHELSLFLISNNDYKNLKNLINKCNLKLSKIISKCFIEGANLINKNLNLETFFKIEINESFSQVFFFENSALKFIQDFNFGTNIIIQDISKITGLNKDVIIEILQNSNISDDTSEDELIEDKYFKNQNSRRIKKKLLIDIARARIQEISELIILKNINFLSLLIKDTPIFLKINDFNNKYFKEIIKFYFSNKNNFELINLGREFSDNFYNDASKIVQYGWKKEAVPVVQEKRSILARFFNLLFK